MTERFFNVSYTCRENGKNVRHDGLMSGPDMKAVFERFLDNHKNEIVTEFAIDELLDG